MTEAAAILDAVTAAADAGAPFTPRDLLQFEANDVRRLFDTGQLEKKALLFGGRETTIIIAAARPRQAAEPADNVDGDQVDEEDFDAAELRYLEVAYTSGVSFADMIRRLKRSATEILREAWRRKLDRPGALYAKTRRERSLAGKDRFEDPIPAWRIKRYRGLLEEARLRGQNARDDGEDLEHRALRRAFNLGRRDCEASGRLARHQERWSQEELEELEELRSLGLTMTQISKQMQRSPASLYEKVRALGIYKRIPPWHEDEDLMLIGVIEQGGTNKEAAELLPGRSVSACKQRALYLLGPRGAAPWREDEREDLRRAMLAGENIKAWAKAHGRGVSACRWQCHRMGLRHPGVSDPYTPEEDAEILRCYRAKIPPAVIAAKLGRTTRGIYTRAFKIGAAGHRLGGFRGALVKRYEVEYIRARVAQGWTGKEIATRMNRTQHMVYRIAAQYGIRWRRRGPKPREDIAA